MGWTPALQAGYSDRFDSDILHQYSSNLDRYQCSISLVVKRDLAKVESRVQLSYIAPGAEV